MDWKLEMIDAVAVEIKAGVADIQEAIKLLQPVGEDYLISFPATTRQWEILLTATHTTAMTKAERLVLAVMRRTIIEALPPWSAANELP